MPGTIHAAVAEQAARRPDRVALVGDGCRLSYAELAARSDLVAGRLMAAGVLPGDRVAVLLDRTVRLPVLLLGILKCGGVYGCLDRRWPAARIDAILDRLGARVVIAEQPVAGARQLTPDELLGGTGRPGTENLPGTEDPATEELPGIEGLPRAEDLPQVGPDAPAAVFFTSGTTGTPKGVLSPHAATTRLFGPDGLPGFDEAAVVTQAAPSSWDAYSLETWGALCTGGTLVAVVDDYFLPLDLAELRQRHGVNCVWLTASLFNMFLDTYPECFDGIRYVYTGGERLSAGHVRRFLREYPQIRLFNGYGPVESCVFATVHEIRPADVEAEVPIGRPVAHTEVLVLDGDRRCAVDEPGEIHVAGRGLAHGYLDDPALTAEKFRTVLVDGAPVRTYRTGDRGSWDADGVLHFHGRADRQVKVRGHRLELAEIELAAREVLAELEHCVVLPVPDQAGNVEQLALLFTGRGQDAGPLTDRQVSEVRRRLGSRLPDYAVPGLVRRLAGFPTTANGKLDTAALLARLTD